MRNTNAYLASLIAAKLLLQDWRVDPVAGVVYGRGQRALLGSEHTAGYRTLQIIVSGRANTVFIHRVIWQAAHGPIADGLQVNHINGVKYDNRIANLELVTNAENSRHALRTGLRVPARGVAHASAKLDDDKVRHIRKLLASGLTHRGVAEMTGVAYQTIGSVAARRTWDHVV